jgi:hypothetical protein
METHEGKWMGLRLAGRARILTAVIALVSALALAAPGVAGAATFGFRSYSTNNAPVSTSSSLTITQNTSMIVDVSGTSTTATATVSWSDVSWSDSTLVD